MVKSSCNVFGTSLQNLIAESNASDAMLVCSQVGPHQSTSPPCASGGVTSLTRAEDSNGHGEEGVLLSTADQLTHHVDEVVEVCSSREYIHLALLQGAMKRGDLENTEVSLPEGGGEERELILGGHRFDVSLRDGGGAKRRTKDKVVRRRKRKEVVQRGTSRDRIANWSTDMSVRTSQWLPTEGSQHPAITPSMASRGTPGGQRGWYHLHLALDMRADRLLGQQFLPVSRRSRNTATKLER